MSGRRSILHEAGQEAVALGHHWFGEEHVLLALLAADLDGGSARALTEAGLTHDTVAEALTARIERLGPPTPREHDVLLVSSDEGFYANKDSPDLHPDLAASAAGHVRLTRLLEDAVKLLQETVPALDLVPRQRTFEGSAIRMRAHDLAGVESVMEELRRVVEAPEPYDELHPETVALYEELRRRRRRTG